MVLVVGVLGWGGGRAGGSGSCLRLVHLHWTMHDPDNMTLQALQDVLQRRGIHGEMSSEAEHCRRRPDLPWPALTRILRKWNPPAPACPCQLPLPPVEAGVMTDDAWKQQMMVLYRQHVMPKPQRKARNRRERSAASSTDQAKVPAAAQFATAADTSPSRTATSAALPAGSGAVALPQTPAASEAAAAAAAAAAGTSAATAMVEQQLRSQHLSSDAALVRAKVRVAVFSLVPWHVRGRPGSGRGTGRSHRAGPCARGGRGQGGGTGDAPTLPCAGTTFGLICGVRTVHVHFIPRNPTRDAGHLSVGLS